MKKHTGSWLVIFWALSLALPIYSMADMKMTLRTEDGFSVTTNTPTIKGFSVDNDNNLVVILEDPPILDFGNPYPQITIDTPSSCTITNNAYVKANPGTTFSFAVRTTTGATLSADTAHQGRSIVPDNYGATFVASGNTGTFSWNTAGTAGTGNILSAPRGRYLAVFNATQSTYTSQLVVMVNISQQYRLSLTAGANGTVSPAGDSYYDPGTQVQISATPGQGFSFSGWSDGGTGNPRTVTMDQDRTITATFTQTPTTQQYTVAISVSPAGAGTVSGAGTYNAQASVTVNATANSGYTFSSWSESTTYVSYSASYTFEIRATRNLVANFTSTTTQQYTVSTSVYPSGAGTVSGAGTYNAGASVTVYATANSGYTFNNWTEGTTPVSQSASYQFSMPSNNRTLVANFTSSSTPPPSSCTPPQNAQSLNLDYRWVTSFSPGETVFSVSVTASQITRIRGQVLGLSGDTDVVGTWIMPDCKEFKAYATGTDNASWLDIRSQNSIQPNIKYDYIPTGNHTFKVTANAPSYVIIWFTAYQ
jgi:hypothetical protein